MQIQPPAVAPCHSTPRFERWSCSCRESSACFPGTADTRAASGPRAAAAGGGSPASAGCCRSAAGKSICSTSQSSQAPRAAASRGCKPFTAGLPAPPAPCADCSAPCPLYSCRPVLLAWRGSRTVTAVEMIANVGTGVDTGVETGAGACVETGVGSRSSGASCLWLGERDKSEDEEGAREPKRTCSVEKVSELEEIEGDMQTMKIILPFPLSESLSTRVSLEFLKGMCVLDRSISAEMQCPRFDSDPLMHVSSWMRISFSSGEMS